MAEITVSIVSHGHGSLLPDLLTDLSLCPEVDEVIVIRNIPEPSIAISAPIRLSIIENPKPIGFGANHNAAFRMIKTPYFVVLNPDIRLDENPFPTLLKCMQSNDSALCAPAVVNPAGGLEDSARHFPTSFGLAKKALLRCKGRLLYDLGSPPMPVPWVAGMFMLIRSSDYIALNGFDENYFLYYEDVDLCARLWESGRKVMLCPSVHVIHDARRESHRNPKYMLWHMTSMARYFFKHAAYAFNLRNIS